MIKFVIPKLVGEYGDFVEGDMRLTEEQMEDLFSPARNGLIKTKYRWPNKTVPYELNINHSKEQNDHIELALKTNHRKGLHWCYGNSFHPGVDFKWIFQ